MAIETQTRVFSGEHRRNLRWRACCQRKSCPRLDLTTSWSRLPEDCMDSSKISARTGKPTSGVQLLWWWMKRITCSSKTKRMENNTRSTSWSHWDRISRCYILRRLGTMLCPMWFAVWLSISAEHIPMLKGLLWLQEVSQVLLDVAHHQTILGVLVSCFMVVAWKTIPFVVLKILALVKSSAMAVDSIPGQAVKHRGERQGVVCLQKCGSVLLEEKLWSRLSSLSCLALLGPGSLWVLVISHAFSWDLMVRHIWILYAGCMLVSDRFIYPKLSNPWNYMQLWLWLQLRRRNNDEVAFSMDFGRRRLDFKKNVLPCQWPFFCFCEPNKTQQV